MLWDRFGHAAEVGESWCAARGYHLWWLAAGEGAEHTVVMNAFGVHPGARVHIGARTRCPGTSEVRQCLPVGPLAWDCYVPFERLYWHDPVAGTCAAAWDDLPSAFALDHPSLSSSHRVVHALNTFPFLTDHEVVSATTAAIVICETEIP